MISDPRVFAGVVAGIVLVLIIWIIIGNIMDRNKKGDEKSENSNIYQS